MFEEDTEPNGQHTRFHRRAAWWLFGLSLFIVIAAGSYFLYHSIKPADDSLVPRNIRQSVSFPVYYPEPKRLPTGYTLNTSSFKIAQPNVVLYTVDYAADRRIVFSVQQKPSNDEVQRFYTQYIPLRNHIKSSLGTVEVGAYKNGNQLKAVASLVLKSTWIIATAPEDIDQAKLVDVVESLTP